jgi:hypothetical protein
MYGCMTTHQNGKWNWHLYMTLEERRGSFEPSGIIVIDGKALQWYTLFVDRSCLGNAFERMVATQVAKR